jgi:hypothetical protein
MGVIDSVKNLANRVFAPDPPGLLPYELKGVPGNVQRLFDDAAAETGKKIWRGMVQSIGSGIGKGVIIAAAMFIVGSGLSALAGAGFMVGATAAINSLLTFSGSGAAMLGVGAALGAIMEIHHNQKQISAEVAKVEAEAFERMRQQNKDPRAPEKQAEGLEASFAAREIARRASQQQAVAK